MYESYPSIPQHLNFERCPHCNVAKPLLTILHSLAGGFLNAIPAKHPHQLWHIYQCSACKGVISTKWHLISENAKAVTGVTLLEAFPSPRDIPEDLPVPAKRYLKQALETGHAPDAAILCASGAIDAMLKEKGLRIGSFYTRLKEAVEKGIITQGMADWSHHVRLEANDSRHVDEKTLPPTPEQARVCVAFAEALAEILFVIPAKVSRGISEAKQALPSRDQSG